MEEQFNAKHETERKRALSAVLSQTKQQERKDSEASFLYLTGYELVPREIFEVIACFYLRVICSYIGRFLYARFGRADLLVDCIHTSCS